MQPSDAPAEPRAAAAAGADRTGVTADTIALGFHAAITGAAPMPAAAKNGGYALYYRWLTEERGERVLGRRVEVITVDDRDTPSAAIQVCRDLSGRAFTVFGHGGSDQVQACAQALGDAGTPYFASGGTEVGLATLEGFYAASMTHAQQATLLAQVVARDLPAGRVAAIVTESANLDDAVAGWEEAVQEHGLADRYHGTLRRERGDSSWYQRTALELQRAGVEVVFVLLSSGDYVNFAKIAEAGAYTPTFVGVGITLGLNSVAQTVCPTTDGAIFLSPFPALELADELDPDFHRAAARYGASGTDLDWALWGAARQLHAMLDLYGAEIGTDLTREGFRALLDGDREIASGVLPAVRYTRNNRFGGSEIHALELDCGVREYRNRATFVRAFE